MPNIDKTLSFQTYQVDEIYLNSTVQPEVLEYVMQGGTNGTFNIRIYRPPTSATSQYDVNTDVNYGCTADQFADALNKFDIFSSHSISVVRTIYNANNVLLPNTTGAAKIVYTVSVYLLRPSSVTSQSFLFTAGTYSGNFVQPKVAKTDHSPLVSGTYTLKIGGVLIDPYANGTLPYNTPASEIQQFLRKTIVGFEDA